MYEENVWGDELPQVKSPALDQSQFFAARDEESEAVSGVDDEDEGFTSAPASPGNSRPAFLTDEPEEMSTTPWALQSLSSPSQPSAAATGFPGGFPGDSDEDQQQQLQQDDPFASTTAGDNAGADDDEFGDFGDFGDGQNENNADDDDGFGDFEESAAATPAPLASTSIPIVRTGSLFPLLLLDKSDHSLHLRPPLRILNPLMSAATLLLKCKTSSTLSFQFPSTFNMRPPLRRLESC